MTLLSVILLFFNIYISSIHRKHEKEDWAKDNRPTDKHNHLLRACFHVHEGEDVDFTEVIACLKHCL